MFVALSPLTPAREVDSILAGAVKRVSKQREGSLVSEHESSSVPEFKSSKAHNSI